MSDSNNDAISRTYLMGKVHDIPISNTGFDRKGILKVVYLQDIEEAPSVEAPKPKGEWIYTDEKEGSYAIWKCSHCNTDFHGAYFGNAKYCPHCGAEMTYND